MKFPLKYEIIQIPLYINTWKKPRLTFSYLFSSLPLPFYDCHYSSCFFSSTQSHRGSPHQPATTPHLPCSPAFSHHQPIVRVRPTSSPAFRPAHRSCSFQPWIRHLVAHSNCSSNRLSTTISLPPFAGLPPFPIPCPSHCSALPLLICCCCCNVVADQ